MLKHLLKRTAQKLFGLEHYLLLFSLLAGLRLRFTRQGKEFRHFISMLPPGGTVLDVGANIGITTAAMALARPRCRFFAFEPVPQNLAALRKILRWYKLKNVAVLPYALSDESGTLQMLLPRVKNLLMPGLSHVIAINESDGLVFETPARQLDQIAALQEEKSIAAIKLDVENHEYFVLKGARQLLQQHRPLVYCELWNDERRQWCIDLMQEMDYQIMVYAEGGLVAYSGQEALDFFFIPSR